MSWAAFEIYDNSPRFAESWSAWPARLEPQQSKASQTSHITNNAQGCIYCYTTTQKPLRRLTVFYGDLRSHFYGTRKLGVNKSSLNNASRLLTGVYIKPWLPNWTRWMLEAYAMCFVRGLQTNGECRQKIWVRHQHRYHRQQVQRWSRARKPYSRWDYRPRSLRRI